MYAFPPFSVIHKTIQKFIHDEARGILIVPLWKTQPWFTLLVELCAKPLCFLTSQLMNYIFLSEKANSPIPTGESTEDVGNVLPWDSFRGQGLTDIVILLRSHRTTTLQAYRPHLEWWERYCIAHRVDPIMPSVGDTLSFLQSLLDLETLKYSALNTARSALSFIIILADNQKFGDHPLVTRFMKGIFNLHPPTPRYINVWDPNEVLTVLKHKPLIPARCFAVLCCGYTLTDFPISIRLTSLALWQSNDCPSASKATLMNMDKYFMWIHYERLHNHNKAKHNKTVCIFLGIYCRWLRTFWRVQGLTFHISEPLLGT